MWIISKVFLKITRATIILKCDDRSEKNSIQNDGITCFSLMSDGMRGLVSVLSQSTGDTTEGNAPSINSSDKALLEISIVGTSKSSWSWDGDVWGGARLKVLTWSSGKLWRQVSKLSLKWNPSMIAGLSTTQARRKSQLLTTCHV